MAMDSTTRTTAGRLRTEDSFLMQRIGFFSIRGYWRSPLAIFVIVVVTAVALGGLQKLGTGLGVGVAWSALIAYIWSFQATLNQDIVEKMHDMDPSLQLVDYCFDVFGNSRLKLNSSRGEWQIDIPNRHSAPAVTFRGPNQLYRVIGSCPGFRAELREMMESVGCVSAGA